MKHFFHLKQTLAFVLFCLGLTVSLSAQFSQQGAKLVGTGNTGAARQGQSVTLSADGNTALVGGRFDNSNQGAVWVYTRSGSTWTQQGSKLIGTGNTGAARQGHSVALSADGNTALVGGYSDNSNQGAVWVYTRSGSTWTQQGSKLVGTGNTGAAQQGYSVALSADGNTALVGGRYDNDNQGAVWIYTRSGSTWTQQGSKLIGTGNVSLAQQGHSVALSSDGNTALVGGYNDNFYQGAVWVFTRAGSTWTQQGSKLVGTGNAGTAYQGQSVALSNDGNTALVGGNGDNDNQGAVWIFTRAGSTWTQQGSKLVGTGNTGTALQGQSVALSDDGNTALVGGYTDNSSQGATWVYVRSGSTWTQQGSKLVGTGNTGTAYQGHSVALSDDGNTALVGGYTDNTNQGAAWVFTNSVCNCDPSCSPIPTLAGTYTATTSRTDAGTGITHYCDASGNLLLSTKPVTSGSTTTIPSAAVQVKVGTTAATFYPKWCGGTTAADKCFMVKTPTTGGNVLINRWWHIDAAQVTGTAINGANQLQISTYFSDTEFTALQTQMNTNSVVPALTSVTSLILYQPVASTPLAKFANPNLVKPLTFAKVTNGASAGIPFWQHTVRSNGVNEATFNVNSIVNSGGIGKF